MGCKLPESKYRGHSRTYTSVPAAGYHPRFWPLQRFAALPKQPRRKLFQSTLKSVHHSSCHLHSLLCQLHYLTYRLRSLTRVSSCRSNLSEGELINGDDSSSPSMPTVLGNQIPLSVVQCYGLRVIGILAVHRELGVDVFVSRYCSASLDLTFDSCAPTLRMAAFCQVS